MIPVIWWTVHDGIDARGPWDTGILEKMFRGDLWRHSWEFEHFTAETAPESDTAIYVIPARHHTSPTDITVLNADLARHRAVLVILCGDEEGQFPWRSVKHDNARWWVQMPHPFTYADMTEFAFFFGNGFEDRPMPGGTPKTLNWAFLGQGTNRRRTSAIAGLKHLRQRVNGVIQSTEGFAQGLPKDEYLATLASAWVCPAPSGPQHVDTFRAYEALELNSIPIVDGCTPDGPMYYWEMVYGPNLPFPVVENWPSVGGLIEDLLSRRQYHVAACSAWWQQQKRRMITRLNSDLRLMLCEAPGEAAQDKMTAIITTSPSPDHPDMTHLKMTVASVRKVFGDVEIIIACDGVRPEQEHLRDRYEQYLYDLCVWTEHEQTNIVPWVADRWLHQANTTKAAMTSLGVNPVLLFLEHDTPLVDDEYIDVDGCVDLIALGHLDMLRFHHESHILDVHEHLMVDHETIVMAGVPVRRTRQWSQRPHLASSSYYFRVLHEHFTDRSRGMIEDRMHSVVQSFPFARHRIAIYHPETGNIKRSWHTDARGDQPKFEMRY